MQFKRFTAALCAASIALTQTAIVPISVSADNTAPYDEPTATQSFTDQYSFILGAGSTSVSAAPSANSVTLDGSAVTDTSSELSFFYGGSINSDFAFQDGDVFNFSVEGLTVTASKDQTTTVAEQTIPLGTYDQTYTSLENIIFDKDQCSEAIQGGRIIVNYSDFIKDGFTQIPTLYIMEADGNTIDTNDYSVSGDEAYFNLTADIARSIMNGGFTLVVSNLTLKSVSLSVPAHDEQIQIETSAEIGSSSWSITAENGVLSTADQIVNLTDSIFTDLSDFSENGSVTAAWTSFTCSLERNETETEEDGGITINEKNFPDEIFRNYVSDNFDTNKSGILSDSEIAAAKTIDIRSSGITNLTGIEYFTEAESLYLDYTNPSVCDISKNIKLKELTLTYSRINYIDITKNTQLETIDAHMCNLSRLDTSKCTKLKSLNVGGSKIIALDLSNCSELTEFYPSEPYIFISAQNDRFDLSTFSEYGLDVSKIISVSNAKLNGSILIFDDDADSASYTYDTGIDGKPLNVTLYINERTYSGFIISYEADGTQNTVPCETWNDVLKTINNNSIDYTITLQSDVDVSSLKFPSAAKSITLISDGDAKTITTNSSSVSIPTNVTLKNIGIESTAKTFTITAGKNLTIDEFTSKSLTNLNGGANSTLSILSENNNTIDFGINKFGTVRICKYTEFNKTVNVGSFEFENECYIQISTNSVTVNNIVGNAKILYTNEYTPITINGNVTNGPLSFYYYAEYGLPILFKNGSTIAVSKTADLSSFAISAASLPDNSTITRVGSDIKVMENAFKLSCNDTEVGTYALWSDVIAAINDPTAYYAVEVLTDVDLGGAFTMPKAGTFGSLEIWSNDSLLKTLSFTGNVVLTGKTIFRFIKPESYKKVGNVNQPAKFTITANYDLTIKNGFDSDTLTAINGSAKSTLKLYLVSIYCDIIGFNTIDVALYAELGGTVKATNLALNSEEFSNSIKIGQNPVTVSNIIYDKGAEIQYIGENFTPITVTGSIINETDSKLKIVLLNANNERLKFSAGDTVLISKTADPSLLEIVSKFLPDDGNSYTLARVGSDVKVMTEAFKLSCNDSEVGSYAEWSDVIAAINEPTANYTVKVLADIDIGGAFTMPKAGTFQSLSISSQSAGKTLSFTGNIALTGRTSFYNIKLESYEKVGNACQPANFTMTANYDIYINALYSDTLTTINGSEKSKLSIDGSYDSIYTVNFEINKFGTVDLDHNIEFRKAVNVGKLCNSQATVYTGANSVTVKDIEDFFIIYTTDDLTPITVTGNVVSNSNIVFSLVNSNDYTTYKKFDNNTVVLKSKTADLSKIKINTNCLPDDGNSYTLTRVGSDVKIIANALKLSCNGSEVGTYALWSDVIAAINDPTADYAVEVLTDTDLDGEFTMPKAGTFKSLSITSGTFQTRTLSFTGNVVLTGKTSFTYIKLESYKKVGNACQPSNFTITANYDLEIGGDFDCETLTAINGSAKSTLKLNNVSIYCDIIGFNTIDVDNYVWLNGTVKTTTLELGYSNINVGQNSVTIANIIYGNKAFIRYTDKNFTPITVTGSITTETDSKLSIELYYYNDSTPKFNANDTVLISKTADLSQLEINSNCLPDDENSYTLARVGSDVKIMTEAFVVEYNEQTEVFAQWSDVLDLIATNAKAGNKGYSYDVILVSDYDMNGSFKMPAANTYSWLYIRSQNEPKTIKFTGNISLTGDTTIYNVNLDSQKKVKNEIQSVEFSIYAGQNLFNLYNTDSKIKSITSSRTIKINNLTVGTVTAYCVQILPESTLSFNNSSSSLNSLAANADDWVGKDAPQTTVNITGNLTAKTLLMIDMGNVYVGGVINAGGIATNADSTIVVNKQAKGKYPLVIGKSGIDVGDDDQIKFVLLDPETGKTAKITDETILGTITGPYANSLAPSNDNLEADDSYYIIKSGNKLIAKPKDTAGLVEVVINRDTAYYKSLDEAIKDINATGKASDYIEIRLTQDMFKSPIAKLPLPNEGKYDRLVYSANSDVTIDLTGDLTLTGSLTLNENVTLNKVDKNGNVLPISVNVGKYTLSAKGTLSAKDISAINAVSQFANISGTGEFITYKDAEISGKLTGATLVLFGNTVTLGEKAVFNASIVAHSNSTLAYTNAKNVTFVSISGKGLRIAGEFAENDTVANITGDYTKDAAVINGGLKVVRSGSTLKAVTAENVVEVTDKASKTRTYDSLASAITDISRINDKEAEYTITVKDNDTFVLPAANTYGKLKLAAKNNVKTVLTTAKDLTLTGNLVIGENVFINKTNGSAMSVNLGNYDLSLEENAGIAYDFEKNVSRFTNISGKGGFYSSNSCTVSGKLNVGFYSVLETTLGEKASFSAAKIKALNNVDKLIYPISIAKNVKLGDIEGSSLTLIIDGVKSGDQVAVLTGDYLANTLKLADKDDFILVRSGNKLVAVDFDSENDESSNCVFVSEKASKKTRCYASYANAIADINRLNDPNGEYTIYFLNGNFEFSKLTLPTKGKYKSVTFSAFADDTKIEISVKSDIALTGDFEIDGYLTLKKSNGSTLKFTSPKNKDGSPLYNVTVGKNAKIVNGTLNGKEIVNPTKDSVTTNNTAA